MFAMQKWTARYLWLRTNWSCYGWGCTGNCFTTAGHTYWSCDIHVTLDHVTCNMIFGVVILTGTLHGLGLSIGHFTRVCGWGGTSNWARVSGTNLTTGQDTWTGGTEGDLIPNLIQNLGMRLAMGSFVTKCGILEYPCTMASYAFPLSGSSHAHRLCWQGNYMLSNNSGIHVCTCYQTTVAYMCVHAIKQWRQLCYTKIRVYMLSNNGGNYAIQNTCVYMLSNNGGNYVIQK